MLVIILFLKSVATLARCNSFRQFSVPNCTACPHLDRSRNDIPMASCSELTTDTGSVRSVCTCANFPTETTIPAMRYYPKVELNVTRCSASWATSPGLYTVVYVLAFVLNMYTAAHFFYIAAVSGLCCYEHNCTRFNGAAWIMAVSCLFNSATPFLRIVTQGEVASRSLFALVFDFIVAGQNCTTAFALTFFTTSISHMVYSGEDKSRRRWWIDVSFYCLTMAGCITYISHFVSLLVTFQQNIHDQTLTTQQGKRTTVNVAVLSLFYQLFVLVIAMYTCVFMCCAHQSMRKVSLLAVYTACLPQHLLVYKLAQAVRAYSTSKKKPVLILKMEDLCLAICRYFYPSQVRQNQAH